MKSKLELNKNNRRKHILLILKTLFPEYTYITISDSGTIRFRKNWMSFGHKVNLFELAFTEIGKRLSRYRGGKSDYYEVYNDWLNLALSAKKNVVDYLYFEFTKIRNSSKVELLTENAPLGLPSNSGNISIGVIISSLRTTKNSFEKGLSDARRVISRLNLESSKDKGERVRFISLINQ